MQAQSVLTYSQFRALIPAAYRTKRNPEMTDFRREVGAQALLFRNLHMPATKTAEDRHKRWRAWIGEIHFDAHWDTVQRIDDDVINEMAQGKRNVEFAIAVYYRLHAERDRLKYAETIDIFIFEETLDDRGIVVFPKRDAEAPTSFQRQLSQPRLDIRLTDPSSETRFLFRSRAIPYQQPDEAFDKLNSILEDRELKRPFVWHVLYGPGGSGKSRLALEFALERKQKTGEEIGFLDVQQAKTFDWNDWVPDRPTTMIVDYAARETELIGQILQGLSSRDDLRNSVRLLLLERDMTASWFDRATLRGSSFAPLIEQSWSGEDGFVEPPMDLWPIIKFIAGARHQHLPDRDQVLGELERIDPQCRPLYAAFLADAYARGEDPRRWDAYALVENILMRERRFWAEAGANEMHINLCICSTFAGGVPSEWIELLTKREFTDFWPSSYGNQTYDTLSAIFGFPVTGDIPPLEPDILGEVFVLDYWATATDWQKARFLHFAEYMAPWFAEFLDRAVSDFPTDTAILLLQAAIHIDFKEYENAKPELLYNLVRDLAATNRDCALEVFWLFEALVARTPADNLAECLVDSVFNLIVGSPNLKTRDAMDCYILQRELSPELTQSLAIHRTRSEISAAFIAKYQEQDPLLFRTVLADVLRIYRVYAHDPKIIRETALAIQNYVDKLSAEHFSEAKRWLRLFERIAIKTDDPDVADAAEYVRLHTLLLGIALEPQHDDVEQIASQVFDQIRTVTGTPPDVLMPLMAKLHAEMAGG